MSEADEGPTPERRESKPARVAPAGLTPSERALIRELEAIGRPESGVWQVMHAALGSITEQVIPFLGPTFVKLLDRAREERAQRVLRAFCEDLLREMLRIGREKIDRDWIGSEEFSQRVSSCAQAAFTALSDEKIALYRRLVVADATTDAEHDWFPTARQIVDRLEPVHVTELKLLAEDHGRPKDILHLVRRLWPLEWESHLSTWKPPRGFATERWENVANLPGIDETQRAWLQRRGDTVLADLWYLGGIGLVHQIHPDNGDANALSEKLLAFLAAAEPR